MELEEDIREHLLSNLSSKEIPTEVIENLESDDANSTQSWRLFLKKLKEEVLSLIEDDEHASDNDKIF